MSFDVANFELDVIEKSNELPVLVDFWAPWCGPCKMLTPTLETLAEKNVGKWVLIKVNTEEHQDLAEKYRIMSIPAVKLFHRGKVIAEFNGAKPEREIQSWLDQFLPSPQADDLEKASDLIKDNKHKEAAPILESILQKTPENENAMVMLAECWLESAPEKIKGLLKAITPDSDTYDRAQALIHIANLATCSGSPDSLKEGPAKIAVLDAAKAVRMYDWESVIQNLVKALEKDRGYQDEIAVKSGKGLFQYLGIRHPIVDRNYRLWSSTVNS